MRIVAPNGTEINTLDEWLSNAPPKRGEGHWRDYRSAKENAKAWLRNGPSMPAELLQLLDSRPETRGFEYDAAHPEHVIRLDTFRGEPRNSDICVRGRRGADSILIDVEAKADESFGTSTIGQAIVSDNPRSNRPKRAKNLCKAVFGREADEMLQPLAYQLLYSLAAAVIEAQNVGASIAVLIVHEFHSSQLNQNQLATNAISLRNFVQAVPGWQNETITDGTLLPPITLPGAGKVSSRLPITLGKVRSALG